MKAPVLALLLTASALAAGCAAPAEEKLSHGVIAAGAPLAPADPGWAPLDAAKIRPGVMVHTAARDCPTNFVFTRPDNGTVFIGTAAYCVREMHVGSVAPIGTNDTIGVLIYSSFETMAEIHETDADALDYNDFAVFMVDSADRKWVNPAMLRFGGPVAPADFHALGAGSRVRAYTNLSDGLPDALHEREGVVATSAGDWAYFVYGAPVLPGSMGTGVTTPEGRAVGIVVSLGVTPNPGANGVARLDTLMTYAKEHAKLDMRLMTWDMLASTPSSQS